MEEIPFTQKPPAWLHVSRAEQGTSRCRPTCHSLWGSQKCQHRQGLPAVPSCVELPRLFAMLSSQV